MLEQLILFLRNVNFKKYQFMPETFKEKSAYSLGKSKDFNKVSQTTLSMIHYYDSFSVMCWWEIVSWHWFREPKKHWKILDTDLNSPNWGFYVNSIMYGGHFLLGRYLPFETFVKLWRFKISFIETVLDFSSNEICIDWSIIVT